MADPGFRVAQARWPAEHDAIARIREAVFVREQGVPLALEWDGKDGRAIHLLARDAAGQPIGTARLLPDGQIGRMAVLPAWRGRGVGTELLKESLVLAETRGIAAVFLNAQVQVRGFYERLGFVATGGVFSEAGIPHVRMVRELRADPE